MTTGKVSEKQRADALALLKEGRVQDAMSAYERICGSEGSRADDWYMLGIVSGQLGQFEKSAHGCMMATRLNPGHAAAYYGAGIAFHALGELDAAAHSFSNAIRLNPGNKEAISRYRRVKYLATQGRKEYVKIRGGVYICVPATLECLTTYVLLEQEDWFECEIGFIRALLRDGECVLDIGANYGVYTNTMAAKVGETGRVYAFEPAVETASFLAEGVRKNGFDNVIIQKLALSSYTGEARLNTGMISECNTLLPSAEATGSENVMVTTLDKAAGALDCENISFIKIDVEGEEKNLLQGAARFFKENSPLVMMEIKHGDKVNLHLVQEFSKIGYKACKLVPGLGVLVPFREENDVDAFQLNLFFCKADKMKELADRGLLVMAPFQGEGEEAIAGCENELPGFMQSLECFAAAGGKWMPEVPGELPGRREYLDGLNYYAVSRSGAHETGTRYRALELASRNISTAYRVFASPARAMSLARVMVDLGCRSAAATILKALVEKIRATGLSDTHEPFIPVASRYEKITFGEDIVAWMESSVFEQFELLRSFTSFSQGIDVIGRLEELKNNRFSGAGIERRIQLKRLQNGLQEKPVFNTGLLDKDGLLLNPDYWNMKNRT